MSLHRLRQITVGVPDVAGTTSFYEAFGLSPAAGGAFRTRDGGEQLRLVTAPWRRLDAISIAVDDADDLHRISRSLTADAIAHTINDAELNVHEVYTRISVSLVVETREEIAAPPPVPAVNSPGSVGRRNVPAESVLGASPIQPSQLSHVVVGSPNWAASMHFFTDLIGFETSDALDGIIAFTRCSEVHHNLAIQASPAPFLHHFAFEVDTADDVLRGGSNMVDADDSRHVWGIGRHAIGSNWFWYLRDPAGNFVEYTADIDRITAQDLYVPKAWAGKEFLYAYGPPIPDAFLEPPDAHAIFAAASKG
jgi:catechol 2,3-dioxygenase-like lactoylglutathione lyase family enzyme